MQNKLVTEYKVPPSMCDTEGRLGVTNAFDLFMDLAAAHSDLMGNGVQDLLKKNCFWVTTKTLIQFFKRPYLGQTVELSTWPEAAKMFRGNRDYEVRSQKGDLMLCGKTEWTILDKNSGEYLSVVDAYPKDFAFCEELAVPQSFFRMQPDFEAAALGSIKVLNQDTDFVGHMNNVAYVRDFANCFSASEWRKLAVTELEIHFRRPCFEGDVLEFYTGVRGEDGYVPVRAEAGGEVKALIRYK